MLFIYIFNILYIKSKTIIHDCKFANIDLASNELIDYKISCESQKIQRINLKMQNSFESISISDDSNVIITCTSLSNSSENIILKIYDNSNITFENYCNFDQIEIHGSPTFHLFTNSFLSVNNLILYNHNYEFKFDYKSIFYNEENIKNQKMHVKNNIDSIFNQNFVCENNTFNASLNDNYVIIRCGDLYENAFLYSSFPKYSFIINNTNFFLVNDCASNESIDKYIQTFLPSLTLLGKKKVIYEKFNKLYTMSSYSENDDSGSWYPIGSYECDWDKIDTSMYNDKLNNGWKIVCFGENSAYLYCCDTEVGPKKITYLSKSASLAIIIIIIILVFGIFISLIIIASHKNNISRGVENSHLN